MIRFLLITALLIAFDFLPASAQNIYSIKTLKCDINGKATEIDYKPNAIKISIDETNKKIALINSESPFDTMFKIDYTKNANKPNEHIRVFICTSSPAEGSQSVTIFLDKIGRRILFYYREKQFSFIY